MKTLFTLLLLTVGFSALAQRSSSKHVTTDGRQLRIRIDIDQPGRSVHYNRSFNIANLESSAIKALENQIVDSLEQVSSDQSIVVSERKHEVRNRRKQVDEQITSTVSDEDEADEQLEANSTSSLTPSNVAPSSVLVREDKENGRLWMQYTFQKDGEELIIERTANVSGKTEREKQAIIKDTERSFGIKTGNQ